MRARNQSVKLLHVGPEGDSQGSQQVKSDLVSPKATKKPQSRLKLIKRKSSNLNSQGETNLRHHDL